MRIRLGVILLLMWGGAVAAADAQPSTWEVGLRGGVDATGVEHSYKAAEVYLLYPLSWQADAVGGTLSVRLDCGIGWLEAADDEGGWLAAGGDLVYTLKALPLELEAGLRPTWLTDYTFGNDDYGGSLQFASHAGVAVRFSRFNLSYRFQHLSNAGLYSDNDGLNLHLFGFGACF